MRFLMAIILILLLLYSTPAMAVDNFDFIDSANHWAAENIAQCSAYKLMNGYPGRLFMPEQSLSKAEALLVIGKSLGWDRYTGNISDGSLNYPDDLWPGFKDYVTLAVKNNLLNRAEVSTTKFNDPVSRLEMAVWIAKAMNLKGNAGKLSFNDLNTIPQEYRQMLAGVVEEGILVGLPGNLFAPDKKLTRAEMSTILVHMVDNGNIVPPEGRLLSGKVSSIDWSQKIVTIVQPNGEKSSITFRDNYSAYRQGQKTLSGDIAVGDSVKFILDSRDNCVLVINRSENAVVLPPANSGKKGHVVNKYLDYFTVRIKYGNVQEVPSSVVITEGGALSNYSNLSKGDYVELFGVGNTITSVNILDNVKKVFGVVQSVNDYRITIYDDDDNTASYDVINNPRITSSDGDRVFLDDINLGDYIEITLDNYGKVREIMVSTDSYNDLEGYVYSVKTSGAKRIVIKDSDGDRHTYDVLDNVKVIEANTRIDLTDIRIDMWVKLELDNSGDVIKIDIIGNEVVEGKVTGIWADTRKIQVENSEGIEKTYFLSGNINVTEGGAVRALNNVNEGDWVRLFLNRNFQVSGIEIIDELSINGTVDYITTLGSDKIRIKRQNGDLETYYLKSNVQVKYDSNKKNLNYIEKHMKVKLTLNTSGYVTKIDILDDTDAGAKDIKGKIIHVQTAGNNRMLEIITNQGNYSKYYLAKTVTVFEDGVSKSLNYLLKGMNVQLTINNNGDVSRIDIDTVTGAESVSGKVVMIDKIGSQWEMELLGDDNRSYSYILGSGVDVRESGDSCKVSDIHDNMYVRVTVDDEGNVTRIDIYGSVKLDGVVIYIRSSRNRIDIRTADGQEETYYLSDVVSVFENGNPGRLGDVFEGMKVSLTLDWTGDVTRIEITGLDYVKGEVTYLRTTGTKRIEIENINNDDIEMYDLSDLVEVWRGSTQEALVDIDKGDNVILTLDNSGKVIRIDL